MDTRKFSRIIGSGSYMPSNIVPNEQFMKNDFFDATGQKIETDPKEIIAKFKNITGIEERRYASDDQLASDLGYLAAKDALESSNTDKESLDYIFVAHNFGDVKANTTRTDLLPCLASRVKHLLGIENPKTVAYDIIFGCPGWIQGMIQADYILRSGDAKRIMVIGTETLSRVCDPHDRDSMIYADGAGATIIEATESDEPVGILSNAIRTSTLNEAYFLYSGPTHNPEHAKKNSNRFIKMDGHKIYEYVISTVPQVVKESIEKAGLHVKNIKKFLIHQANEKMDEAIAKGLFRLYGERSIPNNILPMIIRDMGNNSVATVPILYDRIAKNKLNGHAFEKGDYAVFASVGAGMAINSFVYKF